MRSDFITACLMATMGARPTIASWVYGNECANITDGSCAGESNCGECRWSWPEGGRWDDPTADCRCTNQTTYTYGGDCAGLQDQYCADNPNCSSCKWSWPEQFDWNHTDAACRCAAESKSNNDQ